MKTFGIFLSDKIDKDCAIVHELIQTMLNMGLKLITLSDMSKKIYTCRSKVEFFENSDILVSLGGDGTILRLAVESADFDLPIVGINFGNLGFLAQAEIGDYKIFDEIVRGNFTLEERMMISGHILADKEKKQNFLALNDIVISRGIGTKMMNFEVFANSKIVANYRADGVIISTPTGSTAYSFSAGGPVIHPNVNVLLVTPICAHTLNNRSLILPDTDLITVKVNSNTVDATVVADGFRTHYLSDHENSKSQTIEISKSTHKTKLIRLFQSNFFSILKNKL